MTLATEAGPPTTTNYTVPRSAASLNGNNSRLLLPIDLSQANCRSDGIPERDKCTRGKYFVKRITAHPWFDSGYGGGDGTQTANRSDGAFTFVGELLATGQPWRALPWLHGSQECL